MKHQSIACAVAAIAVVTGTAMTARADAPTPQRKPAPMTLPHNNSHHAAAQILHAGPVQLRFAEGELRYLYVGNHEVVRRIYFAVRDSKWNTAMPRFTRSEVHVAPDNRSFTIALAATCKTETADFSWTARIEGHADGTITYAAQGAANTPFRSNRIGVCVLYGTPSVNSKAFTTHKAGGEVVPLTFPVHVSPALVAPQYTQLDYDVAPGLHVSTNATGSAEGGKTTIFDMEDQRTYGDSSFKAYVPLAYDYTQDIPARATRHETVTVKVTGGQTVAAPPLTTVRVSGQVVAGAAVPHITHVGGSGAGGDIFGAVNGKAAAHKDAATLQWGFNPSTHLPDDDTFRENIAVLADQVRTARTFAPHAAITISPVAFDRPSQPADRRNGTPFAAAWSLAVVRELSLAGVSAAHFAVGGGPVDALLRQLEPLAGKSVLQVSVSGPVGIPAPVAALAVDTPTGPTVWVANLTDTPQDVHIEGAKGARTVTLHLTPYQTASLAYQPTP